MIEASDLQGTNAPVPNPPAARGWLARVPALVTGLCVLYAVLVLGLCLLLHLASDRWCVATLLLFGPRWPWALPLAVLLPAAAIVRRRLLWLLAIVLVLLLFPLMGLCLPRTAPWSQACPGPTLRVLSCNAHYDELDPAALGALIAATKPDIVALQGWSSKFQPLVLPSGDWHVRRDGQLYLASRYPIRQAEILDDPDFKHGHASVARYQLEGPAGILHLVSLHLETPRRGLEEVIHSRGTQFAQLDANSELRRRQAEKVGRWLEGCAGPLLIVGDFNTPPESTVYRDYWSRYANAFSVAGFGFGSTHFTRRTGVRIDHILLGPGWQCQRCWVAPTVGSPHHPVIADLCRNGPQD